ncbi:MAG TPA: MFS transporter [Dehalococcoidales bacterium]|nr:MFS transporter [Dehalococcoidales bacterium]
MTEAKKRRFFYGYVVVGAGFVIYMVFWGAYNTFSVFFRPVMTEFGWSSAATSAAYSITFIIAGVLALFIGRASDRFGPRLVMTLCAFFFGLGYMLMSQIGSVWQLYLFHGVMMGIGMGGAFLWHFSNIWRYGPHLNPLTSGLSCANMALPSKRGGVKCRE